MIHGTAVRTRIQDECLALLLLKSKAKYKEYHLTQKGLPCSS